ncbi:NAD(P)-dependent alcohol dehydrogenase [Frankia sp. CNm7]|uniref:NAD(P)-dependent alcohol dehydrogenase n=1 Tax=Frankia nepalensis TaxID=1836974 RepID=A0A937R7U1_9ACTN|nr:NAD(P)-dependent alcohol dehydrogenase [Frankia nepalensis]MBL7500425.1 NAD(P)-dependent alcohol dehydrogenase [Frankia nepalensis]MBL7511088.1 NAD(P)-dependent alcohol dehydrogenase [Frankia nepalensis]MBL7523119.1 NAD(P)-dependent alcohol dehydrogenase [Frankia nepalensis]MBL7626946.1 NAD(P)-dependent alcohol dehydrogenase [Frankia nepalensis]
MKAIVQERFGPPDSLRLADVDMPRVGPDDVLVRVRAAGLNPYDWHMLRGDPYVARLMGGVGARRPKARVAGIDAAGTVERVGENVRDVRPGDEVFGLCAGALAEYALVAPRGLVIRKPAGLTFEQAAAIPLAGGTALRAVRDVARLRAGQRLLVNGAAGGVGTFAVQIAVALGVEVTGVCGTRNVELVRALGATRVVDYTAEDFLDGPEHHDALLDNVGNRRLRHLRRALTPTGTLAMNSGGAPGQVIGAVANFPRGLALNLFVRQRIRPFVWKPERADLLTLAELVEGGKLTPVLDRTYPLPDAAEALRHVEGGHARGKVVVTVG